MQCSLRECPRKLDRLTNWIWAVPSQADRAENDAKQARKLTRREGAFEALPEQATVADLAHRFQDFHVQGDAAAIAARAEPVEGTRGAEFFARLFRSSHIHLEDTDRAISSAVANSVYTTSSCRICDASSCRAAALRNWSPAGVNRELLTRPMRVKVMRATGSQNS